MRLLERDDSVLLVVDVQPGFDPPGPVVARVAWLTSVAAALGVPVVVLAATRAFEDAHPDLATPPGFSL